YNQTVENVYKYQPDMVAHFDIVVKNNADGKFFDEDDKRYRSCAMDALTACLEKDIGLAGVSKRSSATWGGGHPLLPAMYGLAQSYNIQAPWWIRIDPAILDHTQFLQWQHGDMYVACLHPRARSPLKIELLHNIDEREVQQIMDRLATCSGDGRLPGYPYPLFDAHRTVVLTEDLVEQVKSDLMGSIAESGIDRQTYEILFGDYHDEFARY
ncbi:MAG: DNA double-strand break repair nuclease NurA, partial [Methanoregula sp.]|nr:DNA double-strand break repair nuclease NurA [Methanoregula sp.]